MIEVKTRSALASSSQLDRLAQAIEHRPGWSFELVLVAEPDRLEPPPGAKPYDSGALRSRVEPAQSILEAGQAEPAFLLAWSSCEAALRLLAAEQDGGGEITPTRVRCLDRRPPSGRSWRASIESCFSCSRPATRWSTDCRTPISAPTRPAVYWRSCADSSPPRPDAPPRPASVAPAQAGAASRRRGRKGLAPFRRRRTPDFRRTCALPSTKGGSAHLSEGREGGRSPAILTLGGAMGAHLVDRPSLPGRRSNLLILQLVSGAR